jgi:cytochrome c oxidase assembly protein subunit 15
MRQIASNRDTRPVAIWIMIGVAMLLVQVILGGITRLTGSGLSITEWDVVTGALPPLNEQQWLAEFHKYQQTPQYLLINSDFDLHNFKFIFFWEWFHRFWGRLIGVAFLIPFVIFIVQGRIKKEMIPSLLILFLFGAIQGVIGWIMVKSGLTGDAIYVEPTKLALHFVFALGLISLVLWVGLKWLMSSTGMKYSLLKSLTSIIIVILFVQLIFGALMAGHKAANAAPTWPSINGDAIPPGMFRDRPLMLNFIDNTITIHFVHRGIAYLLFALICFWTILALRMKNVIPSFDKSSLVPFVLVFIQILLGILTVISSPHIIANHWGTFEWLALLHQIVGMLLLLSMIWMLYLLTPKRGTQQL